MSFPETRGTLIGRIASGGSDLDWQQFLADYWGPICRFASRRGARSIDDAEDVASQTFTALLSNNLLSRWQSNRTAKLRTLLCTVARNVLANQARLQIGRQQLLEKHAAEGRQDGPLPVASTPEAAEEQVDVFYAAWAEDLLNRSVESLRDELLACGKGDYFRVLYGRLCEDMSASEISEALGIKITDAENFFRAAKKRLAAALKDRLRVHVERYSAVEAVADEFEVEWSQLAVFLEEYGGLEQAVRRSYLATIVPRDQCSGIYADTLILLRKQFQGPGSDPPVS